MVPLALLEKYLVNDCSLISRTRSPARQLPGALCGAGTQPANLGGHLRKKEHIWKGTFSPGAPLLSNNRCNGEEDSNY